jgi:hypothetical protein
MRRIIVVFAGLCAFAPCGARADESAWMFRPSYYSHSPLSGERVAQYEPERPSLVRFDPTYQESGYVHSESTLRAGDSAEHTHVVQTWGQGTSLRPYGEWERPYRAGATPYGPWGNPQGPWTLPFDSWQSPYGLGRQSGSLWNGGAFPPAAAPFGQQGALGPGPAAAAPLPPAPWNRGIGL